MSGRDAPAPIVDTHAHLDDPAFDVDRADVLERAAAAGIRGILNIAYSPESWARSRVLRDQFPQIALVMGIHPQIADKCEPALIRALDSEIGAHGPVAIGETGFDFMRSQPSFPDQRRAFRWQLERATHYDLPVVIHQRSAADALMDELDRWPDVERIVLHSFDGDRRLMDWANDRGCYIGIGGLALKRSSTSLREVLPNAPLHRLLLETDAPYLAPPWARDRRNEPANLSTMSDALGQLWNRSGNELCSATTSNAATVFRLDVKTSTSSAGTHVHPIATHRGGDT